MDCVSLSLPFPPSPRLSNAVAVSAEGLVSVIGDGGVVTVLDALAAARECHRLLCPSPAAPVPAPSPFCIVLCALVLLLLLWPACEGLGSV